MKAIKAKYESLLRLTHPQKNLFIYSYACVHTQIYSIFLIKHFFTIKQCICFNKHNYCLHFFLVQKRQYIINNTQYNVRNRQLQPVGQSTLSVYYNKCVYYMTKPLPSHLKYNIVPKLLNQ